MASLLQPLIPDNVVFIRFDEPMMHQTRYQIKIRCRQDGKRRQCTRVVSNDLIYNSTLGIKDIEAHIVKDLVHHFEKYIEEEHGGCKYCTVDIEKTFQVLVDYPQPSHTDPQAVEGKPSEAQELSRASTKLPGARVIVKYPCTDCPREGVSTYLRSIIMHLNDKHKWTRHEIADWLESIDDPENGIDLAFKVPEKENDEEY